MAIIKVIELMASSTKSWEDAAQHAVSEASKSLQQPTAQSIDNLIDKIVEKQKGDHQFINSDITFSEIEKIKKVIKRKLMNIYHVRVEYPD